MALQGSLADITLVDLIQINCQDVKPVQLTLRYSGRHATLFFKDGKLLHALMDDLEGEEVVYQVLGWEEGDFDLVKGVEPPAATITRSWSGLLLEGARRLDEGKWAAELPLPDEEIQTDEDIQTEVSTMAQKLEDILKDMSGEVNGYLGSVVVGLDGLNIAQHSRGKLNPEVISAQLTLLIKLVDTTTHKLGAGSLEDDLITTENAYIMMRFLPEKQYYLGLAVDRKGGSLGNLRLMSKILSDRVTKALPR